MSLCSSWCWRWPARRPLAPASRSPLASRRASPSPKIAQDSSTPLRCHLFTNPFTREKNYFRRLIQFCFARNLSDGRLAWLMVEQFASRIKIVQILGTRKERWEKCANICSNDSKFAKTMPNQCELHLNFTADYMRREIQLLESTVIVSADQTRECTTCSETKQFKQCLGDWFRCMFYPESFPPDDQRADILKWRSGRVYNWENWIQHSHLCLRSIYYWKNIWMDGTSFQDLIFS